MEFQNIIQSLNDYWKNKGCLIAQPADVHMGAGTFHQHTFLRAIGPEPWKSAYTQTCRRPTDGRYGKNPNRLQQYFQYQVLIKPSPQHAQEWYLDSLKSLGVNTQTNDIRFVEDNWESPSLGAWGIGWEVWFNGMEITQFTYFQQVGGLACNPISCEITYGLERIAMQLQQKNNVYDLVWSTPDEKPIYYGELFLQNEAEQSAYNFEHANVEWLQRSLTHEKEQCFDLLEHGLIIPAYEKMLNISHLFNLLDARKALGVNQRTQLINTIRQMSTKIAEHYFKKRESIHFPLCR